jgi:hypothetical protein
MRLRTYALPIDKWNLPPARLPILEAVQASSSRAKIRSLTVAPHIFEVLHAELSVNAANVVGGENSCGSMGNTPFTYTGV